MNTPYGHCYSEYRFSYCNPGLDMESAHQKNSKRNEKEW